LSSKPINPRRAGIRRAPWCSATITIGPGTPDLTGKIVVQHGMISSERVMAVETLGAAGIIFVNPGKYRALGWRQLHLGHRRPGRSSIQARHPAGCGQQRGRQGADRAC